MFKYGKFSVLISALTVVVLVSICLLIFRSKSEPPIIITGTPVNQPSQEAPIQAASSSSSIPKPTSLEAPSESADQSDTPIQASTPRNSKPGKLYVHVAGAVKRPSLYEILPGSRVFQAIKAAGGPSTDADLDAINLAEHVTDGEKIYVPRTSEEIPGTTGAGNTIGLVSSSDQKFSVDDSSVTSVKDSSKHAAVHAASSHTKLTNPDQGKVDINTANSQTLQELPGIGPAMAARILNYRQQVGRFQQVDDLQQVSGIGTKKYAKIMPFLKL